MAKQKSSGSGTQKVGFWVFLLGVVVSLAAAVLPLGPGLTSLLIVLGLVVGFLNVTSNETSTFLLAVVALVIVNAFGGNILAHVEVIGERLANVLGAIVVFVVPATIVVALRTIYSLAKD